MSASAESDPISVLYIEDDSSRELLARVRAQARRARGKAGPSQGVLRVGELTIDPSARHATLEGKELVLTTYEFSLLRVLAERAGRVLTREQIIDLVRGSPDEAFDRSARSPRTSASWSG